MNCGGLLSLKWNNHRAAFFNVLSNLREKECYTDVTLACDGKFYPVHKLILSTCSEYFEQMLEQTHCKHPVIVLKDIQNEDLESLLSYMYVGEVNVVQEKLSGLIKAAECLKIKGLAVPDEEPAEAKSTGVFREKRTNDNIVSSEAKRRRQDDCASSQKHSSSSEEESSKRKTSTQEESGRDKTSPSSSNKCTRNNDLVVVSKGSILPSGDSSDKEPSQPPDISHDTSKSDSNAQLSDDEIELKNEEIQEADDDAPKELNDIGEAVKQEPLELDAVYLTDSNSATDIHDILQDRKHLQQADDNQEFMNELLGQHQADDGHREGQEPALPSSYLCTQQQQQLVDDGLPLDQLLENLDSGEPWPRQGQPSVFGQTGVAFPLIAGSVRRTTLPLAHQLTENTHRDTIPSSNTSNATRRTSSSGSLSAVVTVPLEALDLPSLELTEGVYKCPVCLTHIKHLHHFKRHYKIHRETRPHGCPCCPYRSWRKTSVRAHLLRKHGVQLT
ncbi:longitudinals lacking protein, isoforms H/M/V isoform X5 [Hyalella azteca]|uniref:Longitudinals lacking protein, isoforms H/M/V isoform X4 n=1 Tax=Hyalella azteca TaxID=294128 RepID=A0A979FMJ0_HYAAZ|nr:longitudinals lacking protein, isoforms H/M/V isoform X4 [Hyalella azteca]XP_047737415.1 longitudinals lacking protein, isoforms H/M/V isoform X5 [Hyalella azteca]